MAFAWQANDIFILSSESVVLPLSSANILTESFSLYEVVSGIIFVMLTPRSCLLFSSILLTYASPVRSFFVSRTVCLAVSAALFLTFVPTAIAFLYALDNDCVRACLCSIPRLSPKSL